MIIEPLAFFSTTLSCLISTSSASVEDFPVRSVQRRITGGVAATIVGKMKNAISINETSRAYIFDPKTADGQFANRYLRGLLKHAAGHEETQAADQY